MMAQRRPSVVNIVLFQTGKNSTDLFIRVKGMISRMDNRHQLPRYQQKTSHQNRKLFVCVIQSLKSVFKPTRLSQSPRCKNTIIPRYALLTTFLCMTPATAAGRFYGQSIPGIHCKIRFGLHCSLVQQVTPRHTVSGALQSPWRVRPSFRE